MKIQIYSRGEWRRPSRPWADPRTRVRDYVVRIEERRSVYRVEVALMLPHGRDTYAEAVDCRRGNSRQETPRGPLRTMLRAAAEGAVLTDWRKEHGQQILRPA